MNYSTCTCTKDPSVLNKLLVLSVSLYDLTHVASVSSPQYTEWQRPLSGVHSIMMEKWAQAGEEGGGVHAHHPFHYIYHHVQSCGVRSRWEGRYTPPVSTLPQYELCGVIQRNLGLSCGHSHLLSATQNYCRYTLLLHIFLMLCLDLKLWRFYSVLTYHLESTHVLYWFT
jgi:hypothetical protein